MHQTVLCTFDTGQIQGGANDLQAETWKAVNDLMQGHAYISGL